MFHFTGCRFTALPLTCRLWGRNRRTLLRRGYPIRKPTGQSVLAAGRGLSQLTASFFASWHQGIPDAPLAACLYLYGSTLGSLRVSPEETLLGHLEPEAQSGLSV